METFYNDLLAWIRDGQKPHPVFNRHRAVCQTVSRYADEEEANRLANRLADAFEQAGLNRGTPFNEDIAAYSLECQNGTLYQNPRSLHWIKYHAMSPTLRSFYKDMQAWITSGMQGRDLRRYFGLCDNLLRNCNNGQEREDLLNELQAQFKDARLDTDYPFNQNREEFLHDSNRNFNYLNPARLAWVQRFSDPVLQNPP